MRRFLSIRGFLSAGLVWFAIATAGPAAASAPPPGSLWSTLPQPRSLSIALRSDPSDGDWRGRFCTTTSCTGRTTQPGSDALGFGSAVLAAGWIARRRRALES